MLLFTLREGDYFTVGDNVKISYQRGVGKDGVRMMIDAPKSVPILRGKVYENEVAKLAAEGDAEAQALSASLKESYIERTRKYNARRSSRAEHERRAAAGEISASN